MIILIITGIIVWGLGIVMLGIKCLKLHDDALLHPPDGADPEHWPDGDDEP